MLHFAAKARVQPSIENPIEKQPKSIKTNKKLQKSIKINGNSMKKVPSCDTASKIFS